MLSLSFFSDVKFEGEGACSFPPLDFVFESVVVVRCSLSF